MDKFFILFDTDDNGLILQCHETGQPKTYVTDEHGQIGGKVIFGDVGDEEVIADLIEMFDPTPVFKKDKLRKVLDSYYLSEHVLKLSVSIDDENTVSVYGIKVANAIRKWM